MLYSCRNKQGLTGFERLSIAIQHKYAGPGLHDIDLILIVWFLWVAADWLVETEFERPAGEQNPINTTIVVAQALQCILNCESIAQFRHPSRKIKLSLCQV